MEEKNREMAENVADETKNDAPKTRMAITWGNNSIPWARFRSNLVAHARRGDFLLQLPKHGDYNLRQWRKVLLFGRARLGYARVVNKHSGSGVGNTARENFLVVTPRVGADFFHRVRLSVDLKLISKYYSCYGVNAGFVFGDGTRM